MTYLVFKLIKIRTAESTIQIHKALPTLLCG
jgi:hypothetical protein